MSFIRWRELIFVLAVCVCTQNAIAQPVLDTLKAFFNTEPVLYTSPNGGFVSGVNGFGDSEKLQAFKISQPRHLIGALCWIGENHLNSGNPDSRIGLVIKHFDSTAVARPWAVRGPDSLIYREWYPISNIGSSNAFSYLPLNNPVLIAKDFAVGLQLDSLSTGDTLGLYTTTDTVSVFSLRRSWEKWEGVTGTIFDNWGLNIELGIFPVFDLSLNLPIQYKAQSPKLWPNPATSYFHLEGIGSEKAELSLIDRQGRNLAQWHKPAGAFGSTFGLPACATGSYFILVSIAGQTYALKIYIVN